MNIDFFAELPCAGLVTDPEGRIKAINPALILLVGGTLDFWMTQSIDALLTVDSRMFLHTHAWPMLLQNRTVSELFLYLQDTGGKRIPVMLNSRESHIGDLKSYLWVFFVAEGRSRFETELIRARNLAEESSRELARKETFLRTVTDAMPGVVSYWDNDLRCRFASKGCDEWFGKTSDDLIGMGLADAVGERAWSRLTSHIESILSGRSCQFEWELIKKNGGSGCLWTQWVPDLESGSNRVAGFISVSTDITSLKRAEVELNTARKAAESASIAKTAFLANMSHEIRTPLNAISGMAHLMRRGGLDPEQSQRLGKLESAGEHLLGIVNAVLDLSKIEAGKFELDTIPVRLDSLVGNVVLMLQEQASSKRLSLSAEIQPVSSQLTGDPMRLQKALLNYATNAKKFTETGQVTVRVAPIDETPDSVVIRFEVEDTGIGIDPAALPKLFSAFEQADNTTTRKYGGTGLGLAITKRFAQLMGGDAGVESKLEIGSLFWFTARLKKGKLSDVGKSIGASSDSESVLLRDYSGHQILLVEDEPINREISVMMLNDVGQTVQVAADGV